MNLLQKSIFLLCSLLLTSTAYSYDADRAQSNLASDFAECAAYYAMSVEGLRRAGADTTKAEEAIAAAYDLAVKFSNHEVTQARINLSIDEQKKLMNHDFSNIAILIDKYGKFCKELLEKPGNRLQFWLDKK